MSDYEAPEEAYVETTDDAVIGQALKWSAAAVVLFGCIAGGAAWYFSRPDVAEKVAEPEFVPPEVRETQDIVIPDIPFKDITQEAGINFVQQNGSGLMRKMKDGTTQPSKLLPETMCGGGAFFDFDNDGDADILFVNAKRWDWDPDKKKTTCALYQNDGSGSFKDVTAGSGLDVSLYGMGVACGDYDGDGLVDVFLSAVGSNRLFRNTGAGKFEDVTAATGVAGDAGRWSSSCGWFDCDNDGDLDLMVCNYLDWSREFDEGQDFTLDGTLRAYGRPQEFGGTQPYLYRNDGGKFTDISADSGIQVLDPNTEVAMGKSLGLCFHDVNGDQLLDVMVANDTVQNFLFLNKGEGKFEEMAALSGVAFDINGGARGAMGADSAFFRNNNEVGIAVGNFANEMTALYVSPQMDPPQFSDEAVSNGIGPVTRVELTFGVLFIDADLDGRLDLFGANGHLEEDIIKVQESQHYKQPPQLLWNCGADFADEFVVLPDEKCSEDFVKPMVGRGATYADIDGDGDLDILIFACGQAPRLLRNDQATGNHWLRVQLAGQGGNRNAIGAIVAVDLADGTTMKRQISPTRSYQSQVELPASFGLGTHDAIERVVVTWPDGEEQIVDDVQVDQVLKIQRTL